MYKFAHKSKNQFIQYFCFPLQQLVFIYIKNYNFTDLLMWFQTLKCLFISVVDLKIHL